MSSQYAAAGVDLEGAEAAKARIGELVAGTRTALSVGHVGAFGGMVRIPPGMQRPTPDTIAFSVDSMPRAYTLIRLLYRYINPE